jgi:serine/threonine protein kinase
VLAALGQEVQIVRGPEVGMDADSAVVGRDPGGVPLATLLNGESLPIETAIWVSAALASQIAALHDRALIHRDLNRHVVLVDESARTVGLASHAMSSEMARQQRQLVHPRWLRGQLPYMAPEQTGRMNREVDHRTDFYSIGVLLYEMLTGTVPFQNEDPMELVHAHIAMAPQPPEERNPAVPACLAQVALKLLQKNAEERYQ